MYYSFKLGKILTGKKQSKSDQCKYYKYQLINNFFILHIIHIVQLVKDYRN